MLWLITDDVWDCGIWYSVKWLFTVLIAFVDSSSVANKVSFVCGSNTVATKVDESTISQYWSIFWSIDDANSFWLNSNFLI